MTPLERTRLEKAAADCGFDLTPELVDNYLLLRSTQFPESVSIRVVGDRDFKLWASAPALIEGNVSPDGSLPLAGYGRLYAVLEKAAATARTMPDRVAEKFMQATAALPNTTEAERLIVQRVGQDLFRKALLDFWQGRCCVTGLAVPELLRASHIKPWAVCATDEERLDVFNGLLLVPHLDALFDGGWISFSDTGEMIVAPSLDAAVLDIFALSDSMKISGLHREHLPYLAFHRTEVVRFQLCGDIA
jgi:hypothetical protein